MNESYNHSSAVYYNFPIAKGTRLSTAFYLYKMTLFNHLTCHIRQSNNADENKRT